MKPVEQQDKEGNLEEGCHKRKQETEAGSKRKPEKLKSRSNFAGYTTDTKNDLIALVREIVP